jgi:hypothetical protein
MLCIQSQYLDDVSCSQHLDDVVHAESASKHAEFASR